MAPSIDRESAQSHKEKFEMESNSPPDGSSKDEPLPNDSSPQEDAKIHRDSDTSDEYHASLKETRSTSFDARNMERLGRKQQLIRHFRLFSTISFVAIAQANWELAIFSLNQGLVAGGRGGLIWSYVWNFFGFLPIIMSMAEMASMAPISGAQYHWVSEFTPVRFQKQLSYFTGWMSTLAWQAGNAQGIFITGTLIQTLIFINDETYGLARWQGSLLIIATALLTLLINVYGTKYIAYAQNVLMAAYIMLYMCLILPIWILAPRLSAKEVFTDFQTSGGFPSLPMAVLAGQLSGIAAMTGVDTAAHMSEEIKDAGRNVPVAMVSTYFVNVCMALPAVITICFGITDLEKALNDPTYYPTVWVLRQTMSVGWMTALISTMVVMFYFANISYLAAVARDLFAFSRDNGMPFSSWLKKVHPKRHVPVNALITSAVVCMALSLIYIGSSTAFYALTSLYVVSILQCYMFSIGSILWRRVNYPETLPPARWSLGRFGIAVNTAAIIYVFWAFFWAFWPQRYSPSPAYFNWSVVLFVGTAIVSVLLYIFQARHVYTGPVALVEGRQERVGRAGPF